MEVTIISGSKPTKVKVEGRIDTTNAAQFQEKLDPLMKGENPDIEMDCAELEYTSSQGLRTFLMLQKSVMARGGKLVLTNMRPQVREVFDITGFSNIITIR